MNEQIAGLHAALDAIRHTTSIQTAHLIAEAAMLLIEDEPRIETTAPDLDEVAS